MSAKRWQQIVAGAAMGVLIAALGAATPAYGVDNYLVASDPARHQELKRMPGWVTLVFRSAANAKLAKILVLDSAGRNVSVGALIVEDTNVTTQLAFNVPKGTYTVLYRTSGADGRVRGGSYQFAYGKGTWGNEQKEVWIGEEEEPPILTTPDPSATETPTPTQTQSLPPSATDTPSAPAASPTAVAPGGTSGSDSAGWVVGGLVVLAAAVGVGGWFWWRRRTGA